MLQRVTKIKNNKLLIASFLITIIFFAGNVSLEYATDTYLYYLLDYMDFMVMIFSSGRLVQGVIWGLADLVLLVTGLDLSVLAYFSYFMAIVFFSLAIYKYSNLLHRYQKSLTLSFVVASLVILNVFAVEYFLFFEKGAFGLGIYFAIISLEAYLDTISGTKKSIRKGIVFGILAVLTYQTFIFVMMVLALPFAMLKSDSVLKFIKNNILLAINGCVPLLVALLLQKLIASSRIESHSFFENISNAFSFLKMYLKNAYYMLPKYWYFLGVCLACLIWLIFIICHKKNILLGLFEIFYVGVGTTILGLLVYWLGVSTDTSMRIAYPFMCIIGLIFALIIIQPEFDSRQFYNGIILVSTCAFVVVNFITTQLTLAERYKVNAKDEAWVGSVEEIIKEYEEETGTKIKYVAFYEDSDCGYFYDNLTRGNVSPRSIYTEWSQMFMLNFYAEKSSTKEYKTLEDAEEIFVDGSLVSGYSTFIETIEKKYAGTFIEREVLEICNRIKYVEVDSVKKYEKYFSTKNWDDFSSEQILFDGDTVHICIY